MHGENEGARFSGFFTKESSKDLTFGLSDPLQIWRYSDTREMKNIRAVTLVACVLMRPIRRVGAFSSTIVAFRGPKSQNSVVEWL